MPKELQIPDRETAIVIKELESVLELPGDVVELGCYEGDTSILLADAMRDYPDKWLYLYDSFEGLPEKSTQDNSADGWRFKPGELKASPDTVRHKFKKYLLPEPVIVKGWFSDLTDSDLPNEIAFALLDGDFYESIKTSFTLVTPRLASGGIMVIHDYRNAELPGVKQAVSEFLEDQKDNYAFRLAGSMAILVKR